MTKGYIPSLDHQVIRLEFGQKNSDKERSKVEKDFNISFNHKDLAIPRVLGP